jgi:hypothetical protein
LLFFYWFILPNWYISSMPRLARIDIAGLLQHVIVRGIERRDILIDDIDRQTA